MTSGRYYMLDSPHALRYEEVVAPAVEYIILGGRYLLPQDKILTEIVPL